MAKTFAEQIASLKATRDAKSDEIKAVAQKSIDEGRSMDAAETEQFDAIQLEIKRLDGDIARLSSLAEMDAVTAKPVVDEKSVSAGATVPVQVKNTEKLDAGVAFARAAKCLALSYIEHRDAVSIAKAAYGDRKDIVGAVSRMVTKAAVPAAITTDVPWAGALVNDNGVFADFIEFLRPRTILGRFGQDGIPSLRRVPFRVPLVGQTSGGDGYWVGEAQPKPLTKFDFAKTQLEPLKVANIAVASMELLRDSSPSADVVIRDQLVAALRERLDRDFIDPAKAAVAGVSPASILNGVTGIASTGNNADAVRADIAAVFNAFIAGNNTPSTGVWIMPSTVALALSMMVTLGNRDFPDVTMTGGRFAGLPVIVSDYVPNGAGGATVALVNAQDIYLADDGGVDVSISSEASLQMDDAPTAGAAQLVSLWQNNLIGFRAERTVNWARRRDNSVAYLTGVKWGQA